MSDNDRCQRVVFYGSLMRAFPTQAHVGVAGMLAYERDCRLRGRLYDLGDYPGLTPGDGLVHGEMYRIIDPAALPRLDRFEAYDPSDPAGSEYLRIRAPLADGPERAWVYYFNRPAQGLALIESGSWPAHLGQRQADGRFWAGFLGARPDPGQHR